jgi:uncharacterized protein YndB with AHSA1/START domain
MVVSNAINRDSFQVSTPSEQEIRMTRLFNAPRELVFEAMSKPEHVKQWWGCLGEGYSVPVCEIDLRVGGKWRFVMRGPDGADHAMQGVYREIVPPGRLVFTEGYVTDGFASGEALVTLTFAEQDGRTTMTSRSVYASAEDRDRHLSMGVETGAAETLNRLAEFLGTMK